MRMLKLILPTAAYLEADLERIAAAIGVTRSAVEKHAEALDRARVFVEYNGRAMPKSPTRHREELLKIAASARRLRESLVLPKPVSVEKKVSKLLRHLGVKDWSEAADGPATDILDALNYARDTSLDAIVSLTGTIGDLPPHLQAVRPTRPRTRNEIPEEFIRAVEELERVAGDAADQVLHIGRLVVPKGHRGDLHIIGWIEEMARIYHAITGRHPTAWINAGRPPSPFIRILQAAGPPIGLNCSPAAWRGRVRAHLREFPRPKK